MAVYSIIWDWRQQVEAYVSVIVISCSETVILVIFLFFFFFTVFVQNLKGTKQYVSKVFVSESARLYIFIYVFLK